MSKRRENETFADYKARCRAESKGAKKRRGWVRWASAIGGRKSYYGQTTVREQINGTYVKKIHGEIPELKFKKEKAND
jgi:hypothetical protein